MLLKIKSIVAFKFPVRQRCRYRHYDPPQFLIQSSINAHDVEDRRIRVTIFTVFAIVAIHIYLISGYLVAPAVSPTKSIGSTGMRLNAKMIGGPKRSIALPAHRRNLFVPKVLVACIPT